MDFEATTSSKQFGQREQRTSAASDIGRNCGAYDAKFWKRTKTEDQTWTKQNIDPVCQPKCAHCDRCVASATENRVHHEQHYDSDVPCQHYSRERNTLFNNPG